MDKATYGLIGVIVGVGITIIKEWWFQNQKNKKDIEFLSIKITCMLDRFYGGCIEVVCDDGLFHGQRNQDDCREVQVSTPKFSPESADVECKALPASLMYEILSFSSDIEIANAKISGAFEHAAFPPDYEEREYQYSLLALKTANIAS